MQCINKRFHFYESTKSFQLHLKQGLISPNSICFLKETSQIYTQNTFIGICKERFETLEQIVLSHESTLNKIKDITDNLDEILSLKERIETLEQIVNEIPKWKLANS